LQDGILRAQAAFSSRSVANCSKREAGSGARVVADRSGTSGSDVSIMPQL
jgi:hypothetical protein